MNARVLMLRGINIGPARRVAMAELRALFAASGYEEVRTYVQSGNLVLGSSEKPAALERKGQRLISERFGFDVPVVVRTRAELAEVVARDPLGDVVDEPKRYQVTFLSQPLGRGGMASLEELVLPSERLAASGRELYAWHPEGVARSKLAGALSAKSLGVGATARNWTTVTTLLGMAAEVEGR